MKHSKKVYWLLGIAWFITLVLFVALRAKMIIVLSILLVLALAVYTLWCTFVVADEETIELKKTKEERFNDE